METAWNKIAHNIATKLQVFSESEYFLVTLSTVQVKQKTHYNV